MISKLFLKRWSSNIFLAYEGRYGDAMQVTATSLSKKEREKETKCRKEREDAGLFQFLYLH
jgi:hypothetical protein